LTTVVLSLISHTNVGKTTLARTLLRRDVGEVRDAAHVTEVASSFTLIETASGDALELWDTPGFGDSVRLLSRLRRSGNPLGWFLTQVWDRFTDRPFWSSQQAVRNVRDEADVVLYLVNASEDPRSAAYVDAEMQILGWIGKPVLVLLNQLGPPPGPEAEAAEVAAWSEHLRPHACVRDTLAFDAFARCWIQEHVLLERIRAVLPAGCDETFDGLATAWRRRNEGVYERSMEVLAGQLAALARDSEELPEQGLGQVARAALGGLLGRERGHQAADRAMQALVGRADAMLRNSTAELIGLHGLSGTTTTEIHRRLGTDFDLRRAADAGKAGMLGAAISGALGGLAADLAAGGLTFGSGALIGGLLGVAGAHSLARAYNVARGTRATVVRWSEDFLTDRVVAAVLKYLAVAHFGRGRGDYVESESPAHWRPLAQTVVGRRAAQFSELWSAAAAGLGDAALRDALLPLFSGAVTEVLQQLYPDRGPTRPAAPP